MAGEGKKGIYDFKKVETEILSYWDKNKIYKKAKDKNEGKKYCQKQRAAYAGR